MANTPKTTDQTQLKPNVVGNASEGASVKIDTGGGTDTTSSSSNYGTGIYGQKKADAKSFLMTPKYNDPFADIDQARIARFFLSPSIVTVVEKVLKSGAGGSSGPDDILQRLTNPDRGYFDFLLQSVDESFDDRYQIMETLGDTYAVYGLGRKPSIFNFSGVLLNTVENDWRVQFIYLYQQFASISRLAKFRQNDMKNFITLKYDSIFAQGALLGMRTALRSDNEMACPFSFSMLVTKYDWVDLSQAVNSTTITDFTNGVVASPRTYNVKFFSSASTESRSAGITNRLADNAPLAVNPAVQAKETVKTKTR